MVHDRFTHLAKSDEWIGVRLLWFGWAKNNTLLKQREEEKICMASRFMAFVVLVKDDWTKNYCLSDSLFCEIGRYRYLRALSWFVWTVKEERLTCTTPKWRRFMEDSSRYHDIWQNSPWKFTQPSLRDSREIRERPEKDSGEIHASLLFVLPRSLLNQWCTQGLMWIRNFL